MVRRATEVEGWKIARDRSKCERPGCPLPTADSWFALLELPDCVRRDLCGACFTERQRGDGVDDAIFWRAARRPGSENKGPVLDLAALRQLFDQLGARIDEAQAEDGTASEGGESVEAERLSGLRYFIALLLMRKRLLKAVEPQNDDEELADLVVIDPKDPDKNRVLLASPPLDEERLAGIKDELLAAIDESDDGDE